MNEKKARELYDKLMRQNDGMRPIKFDLHIHTPASKCFELKNNQTVEMAYLELLDTATENAIEIIAITDHNTFSGFNEIQGIVRRNPKYRQLLILCGIEITCFSKHLLAIFDSTFAEEKQNRFLEDIGILETDRGLSSAVADLLGAPTLMRKIAEYGGIAILAHADTGKGFLYSFCKSKGDPTEEMGFSGKSLANIVTSPHLYGIQVSQTRNREKIRSTLQNNDYRRTDRELPFLAFSDSHGNIVGATGNAADGHAIGEVFSIANLSHISFASLKMALSDPAARIADSVSESIPVHIIGCAINSPVLKDQNNEFCFVRFSPRMNCLIGARGTGKSTILEIVQHIISMDNNEQIEDRFSAAVLYVSVEKSVYAISFEPTADINGYTNEAKRRSRIALYRRTSTGSFQSTEMGKSSKLKDVLTIGYRQRQLYEYSKNPEMIIEIIDSFLKWTKKEAYTKAQSQVEHFSKQLEETLKRLSSAAAEKRETFCSHLESEDETRHIVDLHKHLTGALAKRRNLRQEMVDELNRILTGKVKLEIRRSFSRSEYDYYTNTRDFASHVARKAGKYYEYNVRISRAMKKVIGVDVQFANEHELFALLLGKKHAHIIETYKLGEIEPADLEHIRAVITPDELLLQFHDTIKLSYNVNSGSSNPEIFRSGEQLSWGQKAVALLLLILDASLEVSDSRPLLMDQPEDDLDNSYIYNTLVREFRNSKQKRQIIISTHNANIPVTSDAENIIVLRYDGTSGYIADNGSLDKPSIASSVLETLEGGKEAIARREEKYSAFL